MKNKFSCDNFNDVYQMIQKAKNGDSNAAEFLLYYIVHHFESKNNKNNKIKGLLKEYIYSSLHTYIFSISSNSYSEDQRAEIFSKAFNLK